MPTCLITGANRGLGLEFTRQYAAEGWKVFATCRRPDTARELETVAGDVDIDQLDVNDFARVESLAASLEDEAIDVLILNAGVYGPRASLDGIDYSAWQDVMHTNAMAPLKVAACFSGHVARSEGRRIVGLTSKMGSMADNTSGGSYIYRSAKAAFNAVMKSLAVDLRPEGITVIVLHPGWVRTDMGGPHGLIDAEESVAGMRTVITAARLEESGRFLNYDGTEVPW